MGKRKAGGYFTVEAAFLMPCIICILALLCYLSFYLCNRCLLGQDAYILGLRGSLKDGVSNEEVASYILEQGKTLMPKYYAVSQIDKKVDVMLREISVDLKCMMQVPIALLNWQEGIHLKGIWEMQEIKKIDGTDPVDFIRACRKAEKIW